ncbi:MAG: ribosome silencing factor [Phycisphaerales bacterium JB039]
MADRVDRAQFESASPARRTSDEAAARAFAVELARTVTDEKCEEVLVLDVRGASPVTDFLVIGSGTSDRQMRTALTAATTLGGQRGFPSIRSSADDRATWLLADFVDVVLHLFEPNTRAHYDLETLWPDAVRIAWQRPDQRDRNRAGLRPDERAGG